MDAKEIRRSLTFSERLFIKAAYKMIPEGGDIKMSQVAKKMHLSRSVGVGALTKLALAGVIDRQNRGMLGTHVEILKPDVWSALGEA